MGETNDSEYLSLVHIAENSTDREPDGKIFVPQYQWRIKQHPGGLELWRGPEWNFDKSKCVATGKSMLKRAKCICGNVSLVIDVRKRMLPSNAELLKLAYLYIVHKQIEILAQDNCEMCKVDRGGKQPTWRRF